MNAKKETHPTAATVERAGRETACGARFPHEPTILTSHGTLTQRQLAEMNARAKDKPPFVPVQTEPPKDCPFKGGVHTNCDKEACAWYTGGRCAKKCPHPALGKKCPYKNTACADDCALKGENE